MAKLPKISKLRKEDFPEEYDTLLEGLLYGINSFFETVYSALNKQLNFSENLNTQIVEVSVTAPITAARPLEFTRTINGLCKGIVVVELTNLDNAGEVLTTSPFCQFSNGESTVRVTNITGLTSGKRYRIRLLCMNN
jgi:hypothetical protein